MSPLPSSPHWGGVLLRSEFLPSGGRLGGGFSLFGSAKVLHFHGYTKQWCYVVQS